MRTAPTARGCLLSALMLAAISCKVELDQPIREPAPPAATESSPPPPADEPPADEPPADEPPAEPQTSKRFSIPPPQTEVWAVLTGKCVPLSFHPSRSSPSKGHAWIAARRVQYDIDEQTLTLHDLTKYKGNGLVLRKCRTRVQLGEDGRFGQAELFADETACAAKLASAVPLDDSRELIVSKCDGVKLAVDTDEVVCGVAGRHSFTGKLGCFSVIAADLAEAATARRRSRCLWSIAACPTARPTATKPSCLSSSSSFAARSSSCRARI